MTKAIPQKRKRVRPSKSKTGVRKKSAAQVKKDRDLAARKRKFLAVLGSDKGRGIVLRACQEMKPKLARDTFYSWYNGDAEFRAQVDQTLDAVIDYAELIADELIHEAKDAGFVKWFLSTRGKNRGYSTRHEIDVHGHADGVDQEKLNEQFANAFGVLMKKKG